jgi:hypothetical protein
MIKTRSFLAALAVGTVLLTSCSAGSTDYKKAAEKAINDSDELEKGTCVKPDSTDVGTTFDCTATITADGSSIQLTATIDKKDHVTVGAYQGDSTDTGDSTVSGDDAGTDTTSGS